MIISALFLFSINVYKTHRESSENRSRQDKSGCLRKNRTGLDMLEKILWQPPCSFELSLAKEFFRLVAVVSRISSIALPDWHISPTSYGSAQHDDLS